MENKREHFALVHGAGFGGWSWYKVRSLVESNGHKVNCPDLKSAGDDPSSADTLFSFQHYNKPLDDLLVSLPRGDKGVPGLSRYGDVCVYGYGEGYDNPPTSSIIKKEAQREILSQMSPFEDCTLIATRLRPSPTRALDAAIFLDGKDCDKVLHVCIKTLYDNALPSENQDVMNLMIKRWAPSDVFTIDTDHCPMFSNPEQLFDLLVKIAAKFN